MQGSDMRLEAALVLGDIERRACASARRRALEDAAALCERYARDPHLSPDTAWQLAERIRAMK